MWKWPALRLPSTLPRAHKTIRSRLRMSAEGEAPHAAQPPQPEDQEPSESRHDTQQHPGPSWRRGGSSRPVRPRPAPPPRPDHFLAFRLAHEGTVTAAIKTVQASVLAHSPHLRPALVDAAAAHITLGVLRLPDAAAVEAAAACLQAAAAANGQPEPMSVIFEGLSHFRDEVLFLDLRRDEGEARLRQVAAALRDHFRQAGLLPQADRDFTPHVTVAKLSKMQPWGRGGGRGRRGGRGGGRRWGGGGEQPTAEDAGPAGPAVPTAIPPEAYNNNNSVCSGPVQLVEVQLCAMQGRQEGEYYQVVASATL